jgi:hypothetical protein
MAQDAGAAGMPSYTPTNLDTTAPQDPNNENAQTAYEETCTSYHAIDDFRLRLLGLLPVATGTGVFLLLNSNTDLLSSNSGADQQQTLETFLIAIGSIGFTFTLGLFAYEVFGIKRCHALIETGERLEIQLAARGQFRTRPSKLMGFVNEPLASALIYPASMAAWIFLTVAYRADMWRILAPVGIFLIGLIATLGIAKGIERAAEKKFREEVHEAIKSKEGKITLSESELASELAKELHADEKRVAKAIGFLSRRGTIYPKGSLDRPACPALLLRDT